MSSTCFIGEDLKRQMYCSVNFDIDDPKMAIIPTITATAVGPTAPDISNLGGCEI